MSDSDINEMGKSLNFKGGVGVDSAIDHGPIIPSHLADLKVFDPENNLSLWSRFPGLHEYLPGLSRATFLLDEEEMEKKVKPSQQLNMLRMSFWAEYERSIAYKSPMIMRNIVQDICPDAYARLCFNHPNKLAYILTPIPAYERVVKEGLYMISKKLREISTAELFDEKKNLKVGTANILIKIYDMLDKRIHGAVIERKMMLTKNMDSQNGGADSTEDIDAKIIELENSMPAKNLIKGDSL